MTFRPIFFKTTLARSLSEGGSESELYLNSFNTKDGHTLAMSDVGDKLMIMVNPTGNNRELMSITGINTAVTPPKGTGLTRGYNFYNGSTSSDRKKAHSPGETVIVTNDDHFLSEQYVDVDSSQTIGGLKTFTTANRPVLSTDEDATTDAQLVTRGELLRTALAGASLSSLIDTFTAGETLAARDIVYLKTSDQRWWKTDADALATLGNVKLGIAQGSATAGGSVSIKRLGTQSGFTGLTAGARQYVSGTAGALSESPGTLQRCVGIAISTTTILFTPDEPLENFVFDTAGEALSAGHVVYFKESDQKWYKTDSDAAATAIGVKTGIAQESISSNAVGLIRVAGVDQTNTGLTAGAKYYISGTAAGLTTTPGTFGRFVGVALSTQELLLSNNDDPTTLHIFGHERHGTGNSGTDTYTITLANSPGAYSVGMMLTFLADVANTGAASLNANSLGAKTIKKWGSGGKQDLSTGDIQANQIVVVIYDGTDMLLVSSQQPRPLFSTGQTSRAVASGTGTQNIAHGLGVVPRLIEIIAINGDMSANTAHCTSHGTATGTGDQTCTVMADTGTSNLQYQVTGKILEMRGSDSTNRCSASISAIDGTNITLDFDTMALNTGKSVFIQWKAYA